MYTTEELAAGHRGLYRSYTIKTDGETTQKLFEQGKSSDAGLPAAKLGKIVSRKTGTFTAYQCLWYVVFGFC